MEPKHLFSAISNWEVIRPSERNLNVTVTFTRKGCLVCVDNKHLWRTSLCPNVTLPSPLRLLDLLVLSTGLQCLCVLEWTGNSEQNPILLNSYSFIKQDVLPWTTTLSHLWLLLFIHFQLFYHKFYASFQNSVLALNFGPVVSMVLKLMYVFPPLWPSGHLCINLSHSCADEIILHYLKDQVLTSWFDMQGLSVAFPNLPCKVNLLGTKHRVCLYLHLYSGLIVV